jgi:hypothetical protein
MNYQKPRLERFGDFREMTRWGMSDLAYDGGYGGTVLNGCGITPCGQPPTGGQPGSPGGPSTS